MKEPKKELPPRLQQIKFYFDLLDESTDGYLYATDVQHRCIMLSSRLSRDFNLPCGVVHDFDRIWVPLIHPRDRHIFLDAMDEMMVQHTTNVHDVEYRIRNPRGEYVWMRCRGRLLTDKEGEPLFFAGEMARLSERSQADALTGLLNKYGFEHSIKNALRDYHEKNQGGAIMILGMDNFKIINETYNRYFGDEILKNVAEQIENMLPDSLPLYKLDGDEFAVVLPGADTDTVNKFYHNVQTYMARQQFIDGKVFFCTMSAGTVFYPQGGKDYLVLHKHAEAALDLAKRDGKNRNVIFTREQYNRWLRAMSMRDTLKTAVEQGCEGFSLFYQPQVSADKRELIGAEALLRWRNPKGRMVSPMEFVPILEETKMMLPVGRWVLLEALRQCKEWQKVKPDFHMSINVSYVQMKDPDFFATIGDTIKALELDPKTVTLELTESTIVADWSFLNDRFSEFRQQGVAVAMDDFGTGYSSLAYLKNLSCDIVKIDRAFVKGITDSEFDRELVNYTVSLCHSAGMQVCIEGVEEHDVYEVVASECGADYIQGYLFGRPESPETFAEKFLTIKGELPEVEKVGRKR